MNKAAITSSLDLLVLSMLAIHLLRRSYTVVSVACSMPELFLHLENRADRVPALG